MLDKLLNIGEKVDIFLGRGSTYPTKIEDFTEDGNIVISPPSFRTINITLRKKQTIELYFYRDNGMYKVVAEVVDIWKVGDLTLASLKSTSEPSREQRRESFRLPIIKEVHIRRFHLGPFPPWQLPSADGAEEHAKTENISESGIALRTRQEYFRDDIVYMRIFLDWPNANERSEPLDIKGEVVQASYDADKRTYRIGVRFIGFTDDEQTRIRKFVMTEQQKFLRRQRLLTAK